jgi:hypothetical protein
MSTPGYTRTCSEAGVTYIIVLPNKMVRTLTVGSDDSRVIIDRCGDFEFQRGTDSFGTIGYEAMRSATTPHTVYDTWHTTPCLNIDYGGRGGSMTGAGAHYRMMTSGGIHVHSVKNDRTFARRTYAFDGSVDDHNEEEEEYVDVTNYDDPGQYDY